ncbi:tetratricopeptide repeat protein [uncultured Chryseobacterium sp.]|uniref:tetratricopeptide repeat-containing sensor histidine kinase n=1 Tax=uncultured Chryseobacterium sp. TaxID=259322 RepID=UPI0025E388EB|nr:tetratricopeptide repeat protein [uncultured Chryseobacterium sp.]
MKKLIILILFFLINCKEKNQTNISKEENINLNKAIEYRNSNNDDSAYVYYTKAKEDFLKSKNYVQAARAITNIAIIECDKGDYYSSIANSIEAEKLLLNNSDNLALDISSRNYNSIAIASKNLKNYNQAISYYQRAIKTSVKKENSLAFYNNIGDTYLEQGNTKEAKYYFKKALQTDDTLDYARALNNLARASFLENQSYDAYPLLEKSLIIRKKSEDNAEINSSFATLSDFYLNKDQNKSLLYADSMYTIALKNKSPDDQLEALNKIILLDNRSYKQNFNRYIKLRDSLQTSRNNDFQRFGLIKFDVEKQKRENEELKNENFQQGLIVSLLVLTLVIGIFWYKRRKKRLQQEKELEVKNTQLRLSKKVHDVVANGIYQVMTKIENQEHFDRDTALDELEFVYEKSRDISYDKADEDPEEKDFSEKISELVASFKNENTNTYIAGNESEIWNSVSPATQHEVYQVIRELLVNMRKHSQADRVVLRFERENNRINIFYTDNGVGISDELIYKNGLQNTVSRIAAIAGSIIFDTKTEKGLKVHLSFPVS